MSSADYVIQVLESILEREHTARVDTLHRYFRVFVLAVSVTMVTHHTAVALGGLALSFINYLLEKTIKRKRFLEHANFVGRQRTLVKKLTEQNGLTDNGRDLVDVTDSIGQLKTQIGTDPDFLRHIYIMNRHKWTDAERSRTEALLALVPIRPKSRSTTATVGGDRNGRLGWLFAAIAALVLFLPATTSGFPTGVEISYAMACCAFFILPTQLSKRMQFQLLPFGVLFSAIHTALTPGLASSYLVAIGTWIDPVNLNQSREIGIWMLASSLTCFVCGTVAFRQFEKAWAFEEIPEEY